MWLCKILKRMLVGNYIFNEATVVVYLILAYRSLSSIGSSLNFQKQLLEKKTFLKIDLSLDLYHTIEACIAPRGDITTKRMPCQPKTRNRFLLRLMLTSYVTDISETKELPGRKCDSRSRALCYVSTVKRHTFYFSTNAEIQTLCSTKMIIGRNSKRIIRIPNAIISKWNFIATSFTCLSHIFNGWSSSFC